MTSISKFSSSTSLSGEVQSNAVCHRDGLLCLGLCTSPVLNILVPVAGPVSVSQSATSAAAMAACMIAICPECHSAISACIISISLAFVFQFFTPDTM